MFKKPQPPPSSLVAGLTGQSGTTIPPDLDFQLRLAAAFCSSALKSRKVNFRTTPWSMYLRSIYYSRIWRNVITLIATIHMALALVEPPATMKDSAQENLAGYVDTRPFEGAILFVYLFEIIVLKMGFMGWRAYFKSWNVLEALCTLTFAIDLVTPLGQFSRAIRPFFIIVRRKHIRFIFNGIFAAFVPMLPVLLLIFLIVIAFASASALMASAAPFQSLIAHSNTTAFPPYCSAFSRGACTDYFTDSSTNVYSLGVLVARSNWPVVMLPLYNLSEWTGIFFVVFVLIAHFFAWRLLLASAFSSFASHTREQYLSQQRRSRASFKAAFSLLSTRGFLGAPVFRALAGLVRPNQPLEVVDIIFTAVGGSCGFIDAQAFIVAVSLLDLKASKIPYPERGGRWSAIKAKVRKFLNNTFVSIGSDLVVLGLALTEYLLSDLEMQNPQLAVHLNNTTSAFILALLLAEAVAKVVSFGPKSYIKDGFNRIDLLIIVLSIVSLAVFDLSTSDPTSAVSLSNLHQRLRIQFLLRMMRSLRLFNRIPSVRSVLQTIAEISPLLWRFVIVLVCSIYSLAILGIEIFSGVLSRSDPDVVQSSYGLNNQWPLNFNTFTKASMSVFSVLVTTQIPILLEGLMAGTDSWWPTLYIGGSYYLLVCVISNILIALLLQSYGISAASGAYRDSGFVPLYSHLLAKAQIQLWEAFPRRFPRPMMYVFKRKAAFLTVNEAIFGESLSLEFEATGMDPLTAKAAAAAEKANGRKNSKVMDDAAGAAEEGGNGSGGKKAGGAAATSGSITTALLHLPGLSTVSSFFGHIFHSSAAPASAVGGDAQQQSSQPAAVNYAAMSLRVFSRFNPIEYFGLAPEGRVASAVMASAARGKLHIGFGLDVPASGNDDDAAASPPSYKPPMPNRHLSTMAVGAAEPPTTTTSLAVTDTTLEATRLVLQKSAHDMRLEQPLTKQASRLIQAEEISISSSDDDDENFTVDGDETDADNDGGRGDKKDGGEGTATGTAPLVRKPRRRRHHHRRDKTTTDEGGAALSEQPSLTASSMMFGATASALSGATNPLATGKSSSQRRHRKGHYRDDHSNSVVQFSEGTGVGYHHHHHHHDHHDDDGHGDELSSFFPTKPEPVPTVFRSLTEFILSPLVPPPSATDLTQDGKGPDIEQFIAKLIAQGLIHPPKGSRERKTLKSTMSSLGRGKGGYQGMDTSSSSSSSEDDDDDDHHDDEDGDNNGARVAVGGTSATEVKDDEGRHVVAVGGGGADAVKAGEAPAGTSAPPAAPGARPPRHPRPPIAPSNLAPPPGLLSSSGGGGVPVSNSSLFSRASSTRLTFAGVSPSGSSVDLGRAPPSSAAAVPSATSLSRAARLRRITKLAAALQREQEALAQTDRHLEMSMSIVNLRRVAEEEGGDGGDVNNTTTGGAGGGEIPEDSTSAPLLAHDWQQGGGSRTRSRHLSSSSSATNNSISSLARNLSMSIAGFLTGGGGGGGSTDNINNVAGGGRENTTSSLGAPDVTPTTTTTRGSGAGIAIPNARMTAGGGSSNNQSGGDLLDAVASAGGGIGIAGGNGPSSASSLFRRSNAAGAGGGVGRPSRGFSDDASSDHFNNLLLAGTTGGVGRGSGSGAALLAVENSAVRVDETGGSDEDDDHGHGPLTYKELQAQKAGSRWRKSVAVATAMSASTNRLRSGTVLGAEVQLRPIASSLAITAPPPSSGANAIDGSATAEAMVLAASYVPEPAIVLRDGVAVLEES
jgi:Ion transport protein